jgi:hypothetical protein
VRSEAASDPEADHAAVALPDGAVGDRLQLATRRAANDLHPRGGGNSGLEGQAYECDNDTTVGFDGRIGDLKRVVCIIYQSIYESSPGEI